jgi:HK97 gp10 family phage protein
MPFTISGRIEGLSEVLKALEGFERKITEKGTYSAINAATKVVLRSAKAGCPTDNSPHLTTRGLLKKSLGRKIKKYRGSRVVVGIVGPRTGFKRQIGTRTRGPNAGQPVYEDPAKIAHLVELGHGGPHPAPPHPFMRPAFDSSQSAALDAAQGAVTAVVESQA